MKRLKSREKKFSKGLTNRRFFIFLFSILTLFGILSCPSCQQILERTTSANHLFEEQFSRTFHFGCNRSYTIQVFLPPQSSSLRKSFYNLGENAVQPSGGVLYFLSACFVYQQVLLVILHLFLFLAILKTVY